MFENRQDHTTSQLDLAVEAVRLEARLQLPADLLFLPFMIVLRSMTTGNTHLLPMGLSEVASGGSIRK